MTVDRDDWYTYTPRGPIYPVVDLGEHARRLGAINTFDGRGDTVWYDDFESGIEKWTATPIGGSSAVEWSGSRARNGGYSAKITVGPESWARVEFGHFQPYPVLSRLGFEVSFTMDADMSYMEFHHILCDGNERFLARAWYDEENSILYIIDDQDHDVVVAQNLTLYEADYMFNTLKLVFDPQSSRYVRLILNDQEYDISDTLVRRITFDFSPRMESYVVAVPVDTKTPVIYVDDVILTQNEP